MSVEAGPADGVSAGQGSDPESSAGRAAPAAFDDAAGAARSTGTLALAFLAVGGGNYAFSLIIAHLLSLPEFGVFAVAASFLLFSSWFTSAGFPWTIVRRLAGSSQAPGAVVRGGLLGNVIVATILALGLLLLAASGVLRLGGQSAAPLAIAAAACVLGSVNAAAKGALQGRFRFRTVGLANLIETGVRLAAGLGLAAAGLGAVGGTLGMLLGALMASAWTLWCLRGLHLFQVRGFGGRELWQETLPLFVGFGGMALLTTIDLFALKVLTPASTSNQSAALYSAAVTLARLPYFLTSALITALFPYIARAGEDRATTTLYIRKGLLFVVSLLTPISLGLMVAPETALRTFYPAAYAAAAGSLRIMAVGTVFLCVNALLLGSLQAAGAQRGPAIAVLGAVAVEIALLVVAINLASPQGTQAALDATATAYDLACGLGTIALLVIAQQRLRHRIRWRGPIVYVIASAAFVGVLAALPHAGTISLALSGAAAAAVYGIIAAALGLLSPGDLRTLAEGLPMARRGRAPDRLDVAGLTIVCYRGPDAFEAALPAWSRILEVDPDPSPFSSPLWARAWWRLFGADRDALILEVRRDGSTLALLAMQRTTEPLLGLRRMELLGASPVSWTTWLHHPSPVGFAYFNDLLVQPGHEAAVIAALRQWLEVCRGEWDMLRLCAVPEDGPLGRGLAEVSAGWHPRVTTEPRWFVDTRGSWDAYRAGLSKRQRRHLRYEPGALQRETGAELVVDELTGHAVAAGIEEFLDLHSRCWRERGAGPMPRVEADFYRALAGAGVSLVRLRAGDRTLATQIGWYRGRRWLPYNSTFEPGLARHSPGTVLMARVLERAFAGEADEVDLAGIASADLWNPAVRHRLTLEARHSGRLAWLRCGLFEIFRRLALRAQRSRTGRAIRPRLRRLLGRRRSPLSRHPD